MEKYFKHIIIVTDTTERSLPQSILNERKISALISAGLTFENAAKAMKTCPHYKKGTIFIVCAGSFSLIEKVINPVCIEKHCYTPYYILRPVTTSKNLVEDAEKFYTTVLFRNEYDDIIFCEMIPVLIKSSNIRRSQRSDCKHNFPLFLDSQYLLEIDCYNKWVRNVANSRYPCVRNFLINIEARELNEDTDDGKLKNIFNLPRSYRNRRVSFLKKVTDYICSNFTQEHTNGGLIGDCIRRKTICQRKPRKFDHIIIIASIEYMHVLQAFEGDQVTVFTPGNLNFNRVKEAIIESNFELTKKRNTLWLFVTGIFTIADPFLNPQCCYQSCNFQLLKIKPAFDMQFQNETVINILIQVANAQRDVLSIIDESCGVHFLPCLPAQVIDINESSHLVQHNIQAVLESAVLVDSSSHYSIVSLYNELGNKFLGLIGLNLQQENMPDDCLIQYVNDVKEIHVEEFYLASNATSYLLNLWHKYVDKFCSENLNSKSSCYNRTEPAVKSSLMYQDLDSPAVPVYYPAKRLCLRTKFDHLIFIGPKYLVDIAKTRFNMCVSCIAEDFESLSIQRVQYLSESVKALPKNSLIIILVDVSLITTPSYSSYVSIKLGKSCLALKTGCDRDYGKLVTLTIKEFEKKLNILRQNIHDNSAVAVSPIFPSVGMWVNPQKEDLLQLQDILRRKPYALLMYGDYDDWIYAMTVLKNRWHTFMLRVLKQECIASDIFQEFLRKQRHVVIVFGRPTKLLNNKENEVQHWNFFLDNLRQYLHCKPLNKDSQPNKESSADEYLSSVADLRQKINKAKLKRQSASCNVNDSLQDSRFVNLEITIQKNGNKSCRSEKTVRSITQTDLPKKLVLKKEEKIVENDASNAYTENSVSSNESPICIKAKESLDSSAAMLTPYKPAFTATRLEEMDDSSQYTSADTIIQHQIIKRERFDGPGVEESYSTVEKSMTAFNDITSPVSNGKNLPKMVHSNILMTVYNNQNALIDLAYNHHMSSYSFLLLCDSLRNRYSPLHDESQELYLTLLMNKFTFGRSVVKVDSYKEKVIASSRPALSLCSGMLKIVHIKCCGFKHFSLPSQEEISLSLRVLWNSINRTTLAVTGLNLAKKLYKQSILAILMPAKFSKIACNQSEEKFCCITGRVASLKSGQIINSSCSNLSTSKNYMSSEIQTLRTLPLRKRRMEVESALLSLPKKLCKAVASNCNAKHTLIQQSDEQQHQLAVQLSSNYHQVTSLCKIKHTDSKKRKLPSPSYAPQPEVVGSLENSPSSALRSGPSPIKYERNRDSWNLCRKNSSGEPLVSITPEKSCENTSVKDSQTTEKMKYFLGCEKDISCKISDFIRQVREDVISVQTHTKEATRVPTNKLLTEDFKTLEERLYVNLSKEKNMLLREPRADPDYARKRKVFTEILKDVSLAYSGSDQDSGALWQQFWEWHVDDVMEIKWQKKKKQLEALYEKCGGGGGGTLGKNAASTDCDVRGKENACNSFTSLCSSKPSYSHRVDKKCQNCGHNSDSTANAKYETSNISKKRCEVIIISDDSSSDESCREVVDCPGTADICSTAINKSYSSTASHVTDAPKIHDGVLRTSSVRSNGNAIFSDKKISLVEEPLFSNNSNSPKTPVLHSVHFDLKLAKALFVLRDTLLAFPHLKTGFESIIDAFNSNLSTKENLRQAMKLEENLLLFLIIEDLLQSDNIKYKDSLECCKFILFFCLEGVDEHLSV